MTRISILASRRRRTHAGTAPTAPNYTTTSFDPATGEGIGGSVGIPYKWDAAPDSTSDANWRRKFANFALAGRPSWIYSDPTKNGTGAYPTALYSDGRYIDLALWQNVVQYRGTPTFKLTIKAENVAAESPTPELSALSAGFSSAWIWHRRYYPAGFSIVGDATTASNGKQWNEGTAPYVAAQSAALKSGSWGIYGSGRSGRTLTNGVGTTGDIAIENIPVGGGVIGIAESNTGQALTTEFTSDTFWDWADYCEQWTGPNGNRWLAITSYNREDSQPQFRKLGKRFVVDTGQTLAIDFQTISGYTLNYNHSRFTDLPYYQWGWAVFNAAVYADPFAISSYLDTVVPENPGTNLTKTVQTIAAVTFTCTVNRYTKYLRLVVDGVEDTTQDFAVTRETQDGTVVTSTFTAPTGTHSLKLRALNGTKSAAAVADTNALNVTVVLAPAGGLLITNSNFTIVNGGFEALVTIDDTGATVVPDSYVTSDPAQVSITGQYAGGVAEAGSATVYATKAGKTNSAAITITNSGGLRTYDTDTIAVADGVAVAALADSAGTAWAEATNPPVCGAGANGVNGHKVLVYNGTNSQLSSPAGVAFFNGAALTIMTVVKNAAGSDGRASGRTFFGNANGGTNEGWTFAINSANHYRTSGAAYNAETGVATLAASGWHRVGMRITATVQEIVLDGVITATAGTYARQVTSPGPLRRGCNYAGTGNFYPGSAGKEWAWNRALTDRELAQGDLAAKLWAGL